MEQPTKISFKYWTKQKLANAFGLRMTLESATLDHWLQQAENHTITPQEDEVIQRLQLKAKQYLDSWNEAELRERLLVHLLNLVDFELIEHNCNWYAERQLTVKVGNYILNGYVDWMVATGVLEPEIPYFFIHEYKKEEGADPSIHTEGRGQLLAMMFAAQKLSGMEDEPIYGLYVLGRFWFFFVLIGKEYAVADSYDVSKLNDIRQVVKLLKVQRQFIIDKASLVNVTIES